MTKDEWQKLKRTLTDYKYEFSGEYEKAKNGRNKQVRNNADKNVENIINRADSLIRQSNEAFELLINASDPVQRAEAQDDFQSPRYFERDLQEYFNRIDEKIKETE